MKSVACKTDDCDECRGSLMVKGAYDSGEGMYMSPDEEVRCSCACHPTAPACETCLDTGLVPGGSMILKPTTGEPDSYAGEIPCPDCQSVV